MWRLSKNWQKFDRMSILITASEPPVVLNFDPGHPNQWGRLPCRTVALRSFDLVASADENKKTSVICLGNKGLSIIVIGLTWNRSSIRRIQENTAKEKTKSAACCRERWKNRLSFKRTRKIDAWPAHFKGFTTFWLMFLQAQPSTPEHHWWLPIIITQSQNISKTSCWQADRKPSSMEPCGQNTPILDTGDRLEKKSLHKCGASDFQGRCHDHKVRPTFRFAERCELCDLNRRSNTHEQKSD